MVKKSVIAYITSGLLALNRTKYEAPKAAPIKVQAKLLNAETFPIFLTNDFAWREVGTQAAISRTEF